MERICVACYASCSVFFPPTLRVPIRECSDGGYRSHVPVFFVVYKNRWCYRKRFSYRRHFSHGATSARQTCRQQRATIRFPPCPEWAGLLGRTPALSHAEARPAREILVPLCARTDRYAPLGALATGGRRPSRARLIFSRKIFGENLCSLLCFLLCFLPSHPACPH